MTQTTADEDDPMPPAKEHERLTADEVDVFRRWIAAGAPYDVHWAYEPPEPRAEPTVRDSEWSRTSVDTFVLARLERAGVKPAPRADARTAAVRTLWFISDILPVVSPMSPCKR